ncbi:Uncharacterized protein K3495_g5402 [Podosphaera aphanis]|nr:Uncharacterized protein K3495_g5402 [Podosphaera aphanis]
MEKYILMSMLAALALTAQPEAREPVAVPSRSLPWGKLNFLQTTDTHGWYAGHFQEPQYSADWGDYVSFAHRMREKADHLGVDLLVIDTGDRIEGNGLYDASDPKGKYSYGIFKEQKIDILTTGNHELYNHDSVAREFSITVPNYKENYLASNLDYIVPETGKQIPMAPRYRTFTTKNQGIRIVAFGFVFNFNRNANNSVVQRVEETVKEEWFQKAIREDTDLFLVCGHVPLDGPEYQTILKAIRSYDKDTPIQFFGGHTHIRDYIKYESNSYGFQGGRYMETIGWMSIDWIKENATKKFSFQRRYIDNSLLGYQYHTGLSASSFHTDHGKNVSALIHEARMKMNLDHTFGCAPKDLFVSRAPYPSNQSILTWLEMEVIPDVATRPDRAKIPRIAIMNSHAIRFDIFKGAFTLDTAYIISPFISKFKYIKEVPYQSARLIIGILNSGGSIFEAAKVQKSFMMKNSKPVSQNPMLFTEEKSVLTPGYVTKDDAGSDGDDTIHTPIYHYPTPNCIQSSIAFPLNEDPQTVDLIFLDFVQPYVLQALMTIGHNYTANDTESYRDGKLTDLMTEWITKNWLC